MVRRRHGQRSIFEMLLPDGDKLWDPTLRRIDEVLQDEGMTDLVVEALGRRWRHSVGRGRPGTPAEVVLRMLILKHLYDRSFDECEREVRGSLVYRAFCRIDCELLARAAHPALKASRGAIVAVASMSGSNPHANLGAYGPSK